MSLHSTVRELFFTINNRPYSQSQGYFLTLHKSRQVKTQPQIPIKLCMVSGPGDWVSC